MSEIIVHKTERNVTSVIKSIQASMLRYQAKFVANILDTSPEDDGRIQYTFRNTTDEEIIVMDRNNEALVIDRSNPLSRIGELPGLYIKMMRVHASVKSCQAIETLTNSTAVLLGGYNPIMKDTLDIISQTRPCNGHLPVSRTFFIPLTKLKEHETVFETHTGFLVLRAGCFANALHPESAEFKAKAAEAELIRKTPTGRLFEIVDNAHHYSERFLFIGNEVLRIERVTDQERTDGLYVTEVYPQGSSISEAVTTQYEFEEGFAKFGLYRTREEAETLGNPKLQLERRMQKEKIEHERATQELAREKAAVDVGRYSHEQFTAAVERETTARMAAFKAEHEAVMQQHTARMKMLEDELIRYRSDVKETVDRERQQREMASASYVSTVKSSSETMKIIPVVAAGVAALAAAAGGLFLMFRK